MSEAASALPAVYDVKVKAGGPRPRKLPLNLALDRSTPWESAWCLVPNGTKPAILFS